MQVSSLKYIRWNHCEVFDEGFSEEVHCLIGNEGHVKDWNEHYNVDYDEYSCDVGSCVGAVLVSDWNQRCITAGISYVGWV